MPSSGNNILDFGRVVYVEPNNDINGTGKGTNFTFNPEDYSILVDLQVDVVDRYAYNGSGGDEVIQYTMEWDAKGTKTSLFRGTNGMLTTRALDTSFGDIINNYNQEAIGINSIDIRYNSWNYPEITINFTDIRGASLLSAADYTHTVLAGNENKAKFADNFANTFFSTFFRFPYPRYTLVVKGFYGRPVSYSLCVNDFKTKFNSSTGSFDVTVSFIGYMYGLMTDIPMRLLFVAPYCDYIGRKYWSDHKESGDFCYQDTETPMKTFIELEKLCNGINSKLEELREVSELFEQKKNLEKRKAILTDIDAIYSNYLRTLDADDVKYAEVKLPLENNSDAPDISQRKYIVIFAKSSDTKECPNDDVEGYSYVDGKHVKKVITYYQGPGGMFGGGSYKTEEYITCSECNGSGHTKVTVEENIPFEGDLSIKMSLFSTIQEYNANASGWGVVIPYIAGIESEENAKVSLKAHNAYKAVDNGNNGFVINSLSQDAKKNDTILSNVFESDKNEMDSFLDSESAITKANSLNVQNVAICILKVDEFESALNGMLTQIDTDIKNINDKLEQEQNELYDKILGFKVTLKNVMDMVLAHLDTFMACMYNCMDVIKEKNRRFSDVNGLSVGQTDVLSKVDPVQNGSDTIKPVYLPPFFAYKKKTKDDMYEDAWIGAEKKFKDNPDLFQEIQFIDGLINGALTADEEASAATTTIIQKHAKEVIGAEIGEEYVPTFVNDFYMARNPYKNAYKESYETIISLFAFRCMLGAIYGIDYPTIGNRFDSKDTDAVKVSYFTLLGGTDAENFSKTECFDVFRKSKIAQTFKNFTWDDFEKYITGKSSGIIDNADGQMYNRGNMTSPLFTKNGDHYVVSYGNEKNKKYVIPLNYSSPDEAVDICNRIYSLSESNSTANPERDGFGISRKYAMPAIDIQKGGITDTEKQEVEANFDEELKKGDCRNIGWYFRNKENWAKYFSGVAKGEYVAWFPTIFKIDDIHEAIKATGENKQSKEVKGVIYDRVDDSKYGKLCAIAPLCGSTDARNFFINEEKGGWPWLRKLIRGDKTNNVGVYSNAGDDKYVENDVVPRLIDNPDNITTIGLLCGEGSLFESEVYATQENDIARAFLFLHSLPTSEYGALGHVVSTITKRTYLPSVTDIPYSSALFIGALYYRERYGRENGTDIIKLPSDYVTPGIKDLITYRWFSTSAGNRSASNQIRRPLNPIRKDDSRMSSDYLPIESESARTYVLQHERDGFSTRKDNNLKGWTDSETGAYVGFWDVSEQIKDKFIDLFTEWVRNGEFTDIEKDLALKNRSGQRMTAKNIAKICADILSFEGNEVRKKDKKKYNDYIRETFADEMFANHMSLGVSSTKKDLFTMFRVNSPAVKKICKLMTGGCMVKIPFPRVLVTRDMFNESELPGEREALWVSEASLKSAWEAFKNGIDKYITSAETSDKQDKAIVENVTPASVPDGVKLTLYETLKNLHDKWLISTDKRKYVFSTSKRREELDKSGPRFKCIGDNFYYINSFHERVGDEITLNVEELPKQIEVVKNQANDNACSLYSFMYDVAQQARVQLLALPVFNDLANKEYVRQMFTPMPYDSINIAEADTETQYVFMYPEEASKQVSLPNEKGTENEQYKFIDDSFMLVTEAGLENRGENTPSTFWDTTQSNVPVIGVTFAKQNQSFFKNINVSMDNPRTTEVAINNTFLIAEKYNGGNSQITALGQDLFSIYSNYSYECSVEMMGCACIMPLMYFQLNNIPMFKGTYIIYNVSHSITPGNMTTTFTGQRMSRYRKMRNEDGIAVVPNDNALEGNNGYSTESSEYGSYCRTCSGAKLEHEDVYTTMSRISGVSDKAALRAVEYAETHYTGGFFGDNKLKAYYDPYMAFNRGITGQGLIVNSQFETSYVTPNTFDGNLEKIKAASAKIGGNTIDVKDALSISPVVAECCRYGAFGVPGKLYSACGADSVKTFWDKSATSFGEQGNYFATLLNRNAEMRNALNNKDWAKFASLYKGTTGVAGGVYMPGDDNLFTKYVQDLKTGYSEATTAKADHEDKPKYNPSPGQDLHIEGPGINPNEGESQEFANQHPLNVKAAVTSLLSKITKVYQMSVCSNPKWVIDYSKSVNKHPLKGDGTKAADYSIGRCATYVKLALAVDGGIPCEQCNGGACGPIMEMNGWEEIYRSKPGDPVTGPKIDSKWQPGDVVTIEKFGSHDVGHIAMWCGSNWVSDFTQKTCLTYGDYSTAWNAGLYHFWRYRNRTNM